jgi:hypothetical protein
MQEVTSMNLGQEISYHKYYRVFTKSLKAIPYNTLRMICTTHFPKHVDVVPLGCDAVSPSSNLKMEKMCLSQTLVSSYKFIQRHNPEGHLRHPHCRKNLKSHISTSLLQSSDHLKAHAYTLT